MRESPPLVMPLGSSMLSLDEWELGDIARAGLVAVMAQGVHDQLLRAYPKLTDIVLHGTTGLPGDVRLGLTYIAAGRVRATPPHAAHQFAAR